MKRFMILLFLGFSAVAAAQLQGPACESGQTCRPGDVINVGADAASISLGASYSVKLNASKGTVVDASAVAISAKVSKATDCARPAASVKDTPVGFCVVLPGKIADDTYTIQIKPTSAKPGDSAIDISPPQVVVQQPSIAAVSPAGAFAEADGTNSLDILGSGFLRGQDRAVRPEDRKEQDKHVTLRFTEIGTPALCPDAGTLPAAGCYSLTVDSDKQVTLAFHKINAGSNLFGGKKSFVIAVDGVDTNESALTLIPTSAGMPKTVAVVGFLVIVLVVFLLLRGGEGATKRTLNKKDYWLSVLFFDMQTNSYSLSKCQFYAWTGAAILGYLYLAVSKSFIQGSGAFPDIPPGLPGILMASVGTVVVSNGITSAKGNKGAGNPGPNLSDFIASGGVVAPDRLQFAIWTIIGIGTFLSIVFQSDPFGFPPVDGDQFGRLPGGQTGAQTRADIGCH